MVALKVLEFVSPFIKVYAKEKEIYEEYDTSPKMPWKVTNDCKRLLILLHNVLV